MTFFWDYGKKSLPLQPKLKFALSQTIRYRFKVIIKNQKYMEGLSPMETAVLLMIVGMGTVFVILILIINLSKLMIMAVNKFAPEEEAATKKSAAAAPAAIPANVKAAIEAAIKQVAPGAMVTKITK